MRMMQQYNKGDETVLHISVMSHINLTAASPAIIMEEQLYMCTAAVQGRSE